jgi:hypothetical protein
MLKIKNYCKIIFTSIIAVFLFVNLFCNEKINLHYLFFYDSNFFENNPHLRIDLI